YISHNQAIKLKYENNKWINMENKSELEIIPCITQKFIDNYYYSIQNFKLYNINKGEGASLDDYHYRYLYNENNNYIYYEEYHDVWRYGEKYDDNYIEIYYEKNFWHMGYYHNNNWYDCLVELGKNNNYDILFGRNNKGKFISENYKKKTPFILGYFIDNYKHSMKYKSEWEKYKEEKEKKEEEG